MHRILFTFSILLMVCISASASPAPPPAHRPYSMLYVFGDSYSDTGAGYLDGNGPTAVAYLAQGLGIPFTWFGDPNSDGKGLNFAVSGAQSGKSDGKRFEHGELLGRGMRNQVDDFAKLVESRKIHFDPRQTMFFLAGGLNDDNLPKGETARNIEGEIDTLYGLGARRFMVALLPAAIPGFSEVGQKLNVDLARIPVDIRAKHPDVQIVNSNWGPFFDEVLAHPAKYGITDTTHPCAGRALMNEDPKPCATPDSHFFYHREHPSTAVHKAVGAMLIRESAGQ